MHEEDRNLLKDYVRVRTTSTRVFVEIKVHRSEDDGNHSSQWILFAAFTAKAPAVQVERARQMALADYRYFRVCDTCGDKLPSGMMVSVKVGEDACPECR